MALSTLPSSILLVLVISVTSSTATIRVPRGIHLDIEPHVNPVWFTDMVGTGMQFVELYRKLHELLSPQGIPINADIPLWLNDHPWITYNGINKSCTEWIMPYVNKMTIMAYRDWGFGVRNAISSPENNGDPQSIVDSCEYELQLAPYYGVKINAAVEVSCRVDPAWISFCLDGPVYMEQQLDIAESYMKQHYSAFDTVVIHYRDTWAAMKPSYTLDGTVKNRETYEWDGATTVTNPTRMNAFFNFAQSHAVKAVYLDIQVIVGDLDTYMPGLLNFLEKADSNNIDVELMLGEAQWALSPNHDACLQVVSKAAQLLQTLRNMASKPVTVVTPTINNTPQGDPLTPAVQVSSQSAGQGGSKQIPIVATNKESAAQQASSTPQQNPNNPQESQKEVGKEGATTAKVNGSKGPLAYNQEEISSTLPLTASICAIILSLLIA